MTEIVKTETINAQIIESIVLQGDISRLSPEMKVQYYNNVCRSLGLSPLTQPFQIMKLQGKEKMYATRDATDQLRKIYGVNVVELTKETVGDLYIVTCKVQDKTGRYDIATGALNIKGLTGETLANALMKAETKSKRRATLSLCGLGMLDESEVESIPNYQTTPLQIDITPSLEKIAACKSLQELQHVYIALSREEKANQTVIAAKDQMKEAFTLKK